MIDPAWLQLLAAAESGGRRWIQALRGAGHADTLLGMNARSLAAAGLGPSELTALEQARRKDLSAWRAWLEGEDHELVVYGSERYPAQLAAIPDAPLALWASGKRIDLLGGPQLAMVGSRNPTRNGAGTARELARELSASGLTITSGLALGIDAASHSGALEGCSGTIAVLGSGIDRIYPPRHNGLAFDINRHGVIVSEYGPGVPVRPWQFPCRNRIIAALSLGTLVVEATRRSGSLITARLAAEYGREIFAVPGSLHNALCKGCHKLIQQGAKLVEETTDILIELEPQLVPAIRSHSLIDGAEDDPSMPAELRDSLEFAPVSFDTMLAASGLTTAELSSMLLHLELHGKIEALAGGRYCRIAKRS